MSDGDASTREAPHLPQEIEGVLVNIDVDDLAAAERFYTSAEDSGARFGERLEAFRARYGARTGAVVHGAWRLARNCAAHPLLGLAPGGRTVALHDWTSDGLNLRAKEQASHSPMPEVGEAAWWVLHDCVAHPLIGVLPSAIAFWLHDESAERMQVEGWV